MPTSPLPGTAPPPAAGIFCAAFGVLLLEVALTRIFSFTIWYHFAYLTISVALLGFGAAGSLLAAFPGLLRNPPPLLAGVCLAAGAGVAGALAVASLVPLDPLMVLKEKQQLANLIVYYVAVTVPFFAAGVAIAGAIAAAPECVARLYFWDLVGAGAACLVVAPLIWWLGTPIAVGLSAVAFAAGAVCFARRRGPVAVAGATIGAMALLAAATLDFTAGRSKFISVHRSMGAMPIFHRWTPINRVDAVAWDESTQDTQTGYRTWGASKRYGGPGQPYRMIGYDGDSCASMYRWGGDPAELEWLQHHVLKAPYVLRPSPVVLIIGVGGGTDVLNAIVNRATRIVGAELNPVTIELGKGPFARYNGGIFNRPEVKMIAAEGRHFLRSHQDRYDVIEINSVDTLSALSSGAYVLSESYLYTADAVEDYLDHLTPGGVFAMALGDFNTAGYLPRHSARLVSNVYEALRRRGVRTPERHVAVVASNEGLAMGHALVKNEPFTEAEMARLDAFVAAEDFLYWTRPDRRIDHPVALVLWGSDAERERWYAGQHLNLRATTDESPFFFNFYKWSSLFSRRHELDAARNFATGQIVLAIMLVQSIVFAGLLILGPLLLMRHGLRSVRRRTGYVLYFMALGLGFILLEISFIQRFVLYLGYPTYALSVVLFALLTCTGIGSFLSGRITLPPVRALPILLGLLVAVTLAYLVGLQPAFDATLGAPLPVRIAIAVGILAPLGIVLGAFFPLGVRLAASAHPALVPWAWGINGCSTVVGTILAVILAITWDFRGVTLASLAIYSAGVAGILWTQAP